MGLWGPLNRWADPVQREEIILALEERGITVTELTDVTGRSDAALLDKYSDFGPSRFSIADALQVPLISGYGNVLEIAGLFGGALPMKQAVDRMQTLLYQH